MLGVFCALVFVAFLLTGSAHAQSSSADANHTLTIRVFQSRFWDKFEPFEMRIATLPIESRWCANTASLEDFPWRETFVAAVVVDSAVPLTHEIAKNEKDGTCAYRTIYAYSVLLTEEQLSDDEKKELLEWRPSIHQVLTRTEKQATEAEGSRASPLVNVPATSAFTAEAAMYDRQTVNSAPPIDGGGLAPRLQLVTGNAQAPKVGICIRTLSPGSEGDDVRALQQFLVRDTAIYPEAKVTSRYGPATTRAVQRFQKKYNIAEGNLRFGVVGPKTCQVINSLSAAAR